jgi:rod shape-determining protein MreC
VVVHRQDHRRRWTLVLLVITSFVLITLDERGSGLIDSARSAAQDVVSPIQNVVDDAIQPAVNFFDGFGRADELQSENAKLRDQNTKLRSELEAGKAAVAENADLKAALDIPQIEDYDGVVASVVSGSVDNFHRTWRIDKGSSSGIAVDMPVVVGGKTAAALVGRVAIVSSHSATIQRVDDRSFSSGAQLVQADGSGGPIGAVHGVANSRLLSFELFDISDAGMAIAKGQFVQTANVGSKFPKGLVIGTVVANVPAGTAATRDARIEPIVDLDAVDFVKVLRSPPTSG